MIARRGGRQQIPTPASARPGAPAPWAAAAPAHRRGITIEVVRAALDKVGRLEPIPAPFGRVAAAVLIPLFEEDGEARVILTRRADHLRSHSGEVSFPGGRIEPDETPLSAARREAHEEIGLDTDDAAMLGQLQPLATLSKSSSITPFVAVLRQRPRVEANPAEVEHVFDIALADLLADDVFTEERWDLPPWATGDEGVTDRPVYFFDVPGDLVWGATARILHELLALVVTERSAREQGDQQRRDHERGQE